MKKVAVLLIMIISLGVASGISQTQDTLKPASGSTAAGDSLREKSYVLCPRCGRANLPEANYCIYCGEPLKPGLVRKPEERPGEVQGRRDDPAYTRLFIVPTGETLKKGTGYFGDVEIVLLQGAMGVTDYVTLFGGSTLIPGSIEWQWVFGGPKVRLLKWGNNSVAVGAVGFYHLSNGAGSNGGNKIPWVGYGVVTFGKTSGRLNLGAGKFGSGTTSAAPWLFSVGGEAGQSKSVRLLWESWILSSEDYLAFPTCLGLRFFGENVSGDLGLMYPFTSKGTGGIQIGIPLVSFSYHFK